ncbi:protein of unknown function [Vibrio tapetis subsp. tapetis]|uniref:Uncharacterized protein n=1 Tax=Vibrio tapetis subsp. tapetis TaxID=1671868 RepID=A0A2N8ZLK5_9VIBR|nr:protein of unknown function [Vibrio tapetis subsp. tapetis]
MHNIMIMEVPKPSPAEAKGSASMPAPIVVLAIISVLPNSLELFMYSILYGCGGFVSFLANILTNNANK